MTILIFFIFGLIVGSFLNVVISRLPMAESLLGRSRCPKCKAAIRWYDNIPLVSFILLKTQCRDCKEKISLQYPVVELATGIIFALVGAYFFSSQDPSTWLETLYYLIIFALLLVIFVYDFKHLEIPMVVLWIGVVWFIVYSLIADWLNFSPQLGLLSVSTYSGLLAGAVAFAIFFALSVGSKEKWMGTGDAYVGLLVGLIAGWPGIILVLLTAFTTGSIYGIILIALGKKTMKSQVPFAPFLALGVFLAIFVPKMFPAVKWWLLYF